MEMVQAWSQQEIGATRETNDSHEQTVGEKPSPKELQVLDTTKVTMAITQCADAVTVSHCAQSHDEGDARVV